MHIDNPCQRFSVLVSGTNNGVNIKGVFGGMNCRSYITERCAAIIARTSVSLSVVSSNPGVSMSVIRCPSKINGSVVWTPLVHDSISSPTLRSEPLKRLIN